MFLSDDDEDNDEEVLTVNKSSSGNNDDSMVASDSISCGKENKRPSETGIKASGDDSFQIKRQKIVKSLSCDITGMY
jgi:hypothetical protein